MIEENELEPDYYIDRPVRISQNTNRNYSHLQFLYLIQRVKTKWLKFMIEILTFLTLSLKQNQFYKSLSEKLLS